MGKSLFVVNKGMWENNQHFIADCYHRSVVSNKTEKKHTPWLHESYLAMSYISSSWFSSVLFRLEREITTLCV